MRWKHSASKSLFPLVQIRPGSPVGCFLIVLLPPFPGLTGLKLWLGKKRKLFPQLTRIGELPVLSYSDQNCSWSWNSLLSFGLRLLNSQPLWADTLKARKTIILAVWNGIISSQLFHASFTPHLHVLAALVTLVLWLTRIYPNIFIGACFT